MTTKNIVTDYGAVGDATQVFIPITASGTAVSAPSAGSAVWVPGDATKKISIGHAGGAGGGGGIAYTGTIQTVAGDGKSITVSPSITFAITAETVIIAWATTDNTTAFTTFRDAFQGASVTLTIPAGVYLITSGNVNLFSGITNLTVNGVGGATITGGTFGIGAGADFVADTVHSARTVTANAGDTTITLVTAAQASRFTVNQWCCMTGLDLQGTGQPPNFRFFEFVLPTQINGGVITLASPLKYTYLSSWPHYSDSPIDLGGPATLYALDAAWDFTAVFNNLTIAYNANLNAHGRSLTFNNCTFAGTGPFPSVNHDWTLNNCVWTNNFSMEVDKEVEVLVVNGGTIGSGSSLIVQSSSVNLMTVNNIAVGTVYCGTNSVFTGCTIGNLVLGPSTYGVSQSIVVTGCSVATLGYASYIDSGNVSNTGSLGANGVTMNNGVMRFSLASYRSGQAVLWAVPGAIIFWDDNLNGWYQPSFRVAAVAQDAATTDVLVSLAAVPPTNAAGGFPSIPNTATGYWVRPHPMQSCTFRNCTGAEVQMASLNNAPGGAPFGSYQTLTYTTAMGATPQPAYAVIGNLKSLGISVPRAYAGAGSLSFNVGPSWPVLNATNNSTLTSSDVGTIFYTAAVNAKASGLRTVTLSGVTGSQSGDSGLTVPDSSQTWFTGANAGAGPGFSADVSGIDPNVSVTVTWQTDQYFPTSQSATTLGLRLRLHG